MDRSQIAERYEMDLRVAIPTLALVSFLAASAIGEETDRKDLTCEYPAKDSIYASVTDLIFAGRCELYRGPIVIYVKDSKDVVRESAICHPNADAQGAWSCRIALPRHSSPRGRAITRWKQFPLLDPASKSRIKCLRVLQDPKYRCIYL